MGFIGFFVKLIFIPINNIVSCARSIAVHHRCACGVHSMACLLQTDPLRAASLCSQIVGMS